MDKNVEEKKYACPNYFMATAPNSYRDYPTIITHIVQKISHDTLFSSVSKGHKIPFHISQSVTI
jgi:hypothetical protein